MSSRCSVTARSAASAASISTVCNADADQAAIPTDSASAKRLSLGLFSIAASLVHHGRARNLHLSAYAPWTRLLHTMITTLQAIPAPG